MMPRRFILKTWKKANSDRIRAQRQNGQTNHADGKQHLRQAIGLQSMGIDKQHTDGAHPQSDQIYGTVL
jgi:hypothetical protein